MTRSVILPIFLLFIALLRYNVIVVEETGENDLFFAGYSLLLDGSA